MHALASLFFRPNIMFQRPSKLFVLTLNWLGLMLGSPVLLAQSQVPAWLSDWQSIGQRDGISGECRQHKSKINQCRMTTIVEADLSEITALLMDGDGVASWAPSTLSSEVIEDLSHKENEVTVYMTYNFPGASNRDTVTRSTATQDPHSKVVKIKFQSLKIEGPKKDLRLVRFPLMAGSWTLSPLGPKRTQVIHLNLSLPGGMVQKNLHYLYNMGAKDASFDTIEALKQAVQRPQYQDASLSFIENFQAM